MSKKVCKLHLKGEQEFLLACLGQKHQSASAGTSLRILKTPLQLFRAFFQMESGVSFYRIIE